MIKKLLFLLAIILVNPGCTTQQKKSNQIRPFDQKSENYFNYTTDKVDQPDIILFMFLFMLLTGIVVGYIYAHSKRRDSLSLLSVKPFFMPHEGHSCIKNLYQDLKNAEEKICVASYWVTHSKIILALQTARKRNVSVEIIFDKSTPGAAELQQEFRNSGIKFTESEVDSALMHHKFIIVDNDITWVGSANLTWRAFSQNYENMIRIESLEIAQRYLIDFKNLTKEFGKSTTE